MYIAEYMTSDPITVSAQTSLTEARRILDTFHFRHLPVVDEVGRLVGIITDRDLRSAYPSSVLVQEIRERALEQIQDRLVGDVMTVDCTALKRTATLDDALLLFDRTRVGGLPVVDDDSVVCGMFSIHDLLAAQKNMVGMGEKGSVLIGIADTGQIGIMGTVVTLLEQNKISVTSIRRMKNEAGEGRIYVRINTFRLASVYNLLRRNGMTILVPNAD